MKILLVLPRFLPAPSTTGSMMFAWSFVRSALDAGHQVAVFAYDLERKKGVDATTPRRLLEELGVRVHVASPLADWQAQVRWPPLRVARTVAYALRPDWPSICPNDVEIQAAVRAVLDVERPDVIWTYMLSPTAVVGAMRDRPPVLSSVVDLEWKGKKHVAEAHEGFSPKDYFGRFTANKTAWLLHRLEPELLRRADDIVAHADSSRRWYASRGLTVDYLPVPVVDPVGPSWRAKRKEKLADGVRVGHVGRLDGLHTKFGLRFLLKRVLPELRARTRDLEIHVIGGGIAPSDVQALLASPDVVHRGFVEDIGEEFSRMTALAVPIDIDLGFRVRIAEAFAYGVPVVAHRNACAGMPEIVSDENALLVDDAHQMVLALTRLAEDAALRERLSEAARATFERSYDARVVGAAMIRRMEALATRRAREARVTSPHPRQDDRP